jgi:hypothetical protein
MEYTTGWGVDWRPASACWAKAARQRRTERGNALTCRATGRTPQPASSRETATRRAAVWTGRADSEKRCVGFLLQGDDISDGGFMAIIITHDGIPSISMLSSLQCQIPAVDH